jgi:alanyl-tRNA synthetase
VRVAISRREAGSLEDVRPLAQAFVSRSRAVFVAAVAAPATVLVAASDDAGVDAGAILKAALAAAGGRGGGSPRLAQGTVPNADVLESVVDTVQSRLSS